MLSSVRSSMSWSVLMTWSVCLDFSRLNWIRMMFNTSWLIRVMAPVCIRHQRHHLLLVINLALKVDLCNRWKSWSRHSRSMNSDCSRWTVSRSSWIRDTWNWWSCVRYCASASTSLPSSLSLVVVEEVVLSMHQRRIMMMIMKKVCWTKLKLVTDHPQPQQDYNL